MENSEKKKHITPKRCCLDPNWKRVLDTPRFVMDWCENCKKVLFQIPPHNPNWYEMSLQARYVLDHAILGIEELTGFGNIRTVGISTFEISDYPEEIDGKEDSPPYQPQQRLELG